MQWSEIKRRTHSKELVAVAYGEEGLVVDARSSMKPAEQVSQKLWSLLAATPRSASKRPRVRQS